MFRTAYQRGMLTVFYSIGSKPLELWDVYCKDGYISRFMDQDLKSMVLELRGNNVSTTYMTCPSKNRTLGISMPFLVMIVKNLKKYFTFEVTILDETGVRRRFRVSNFQSTTQILPMSTAMPIGLSEGWNQIQFNLAEFTRRAYQKQFVEVQKLKINANIRLRRIYFADRLIPEEELPAEYKLFFPLPNKGAKGKKYDKENYKPSTSQEVVVEKVDSKPVIVKLASEPSIHSAHMRVSRTAVGSKAAVAQSPEGETENIPADHAARTEGSAEPAPVVDADVPHSEDAAEGTGEGAREDAAEGTGEGAGETRDEVEKASSATGKVPSGEGEHATDDTPAENKDPDESTEVKAEAPPEEATTEEATAKEATAEEASAPAE